MHKETESAAGFNGEPGSAFMEKTLARHLKRILALLLTLACLGLVVLALVRLGEKPEQKEEKTAVFTRSQASLEEEFEDETRIPVGYESSDGAYECVLYYSPEEWETLPAEHSFEGRIYLFQGDFYAAFDHPAQEEELQEAFRNLKADANRSLFGMALALGLMALALFVMVYFGRFFTDYEQIWFLSIMLLAGIFSLLFPEEDVNGIRGVYIMALYLLDTFLNILCELLISKQSKWNFLVSLGVEITEILICVLLAYRFATMTTTLFFWIPIDIISFINWHKHPDEAKEEMTKVRKLSGKTRALILLGIALWTLVVGYLLSGLDITTNLFGGDELLETIVCYLDACAAAVGVVNGVLIFLRYQEQWLAWITVALLEGAINILSGQFVLLVLKAGYLTNSIYGYIKWRHYIRTHEAEKQNLLSL